MDDAALTRRSALAAGTATLMAAPTASTLAAAREAPRYDDPVWNREQSARLEAHNDGRQVFGRISGTVNGVRPGEAVRHLLNLEGFSTIRVVRRPDGHFDRMCKEVVFYTDPKTGKILDEWDNPYTGERVRVVDIANDPYNWVIRDWVTPRTPGTDTHDIPEPKEKTPFKMRWSELSPETVVVTSGGHAWYPNRLDPGKWPRESSGALAQVSELFRYFIRREDLENPDLTHLPHSGVWIRVTPWLPWMLMGAAPGHVFYDTMFTSSDSLDQYRPDVVERVRTRYPQYMTAPTEWYGPSLSSLEHYALEQKPAPVKKP